MHKWDFVTGSSSWGFITHGSPVGRMDDLITLLTFLCSHCLCLDVFHHRVVHLQRKPQCSVSGSVPFYSVSDSSLSCWKTQPWTDRAQVKDANYWRDLVSLVMLTRLGSVLYFLSTVLFSLTFTIWLKKLLKRKIKISELMRSLTVASSRCRPLSAGQSVIGHLSLGCEWIQSQWFHWNKLNSSECWCFRELYQLIHIFSVPMQGCGYINIVSSLAARTLQHVNYVLNVISREHLSRVMTSLWIRRVLGLIIETLSDDKSVRLCSVLHHSKQTCQIILCMFSINSALSPGKSVYMYIVNMCNIDEGFSFFIHTVHIDTGIYPPQGCQVHSGGVLMFTQTWKAGTSRQQLKPK